MALSATRQYFGKWQRSYDGVNYVNLNYDERKYALAAAACKRVMDMQAYELVYREGGPEYARTCRPVYRMQTFPNGAGGIDPFQVLFLYVYGR